MGQWGEKSGFDPFSDRLARDIRNSLSEAFLRSLSLRSEAPLMEAVAAFPSGKLRPFHQAYIRERLARYRRVLGRVRGDGPDALSAQVSAAWNEALFFEVHDLLEPVWREETGERKMALKGLIQAAAAYTHLSLGRTKPAGTLAAKAARLIRLHRGALPELKKPAPLLRALERMNPVPPRL